MKKFTNFFLMALVAVSLAACGGGSEGGDAKADGAASVDPEIQTMIDDMCPLLEKMASGDMSGLGLDDAQKALKAQEELQKMVQNDDKEKAEAFVKAFKDQCPEGAKMIPGL